MTLSLDKDKNELKYYYSENGATLGPFSLVKLLEKIDGNTLVYRDGIQWTTARELDELKKFFQVEKVVVKTVVEEKVKTINQGSQQSQFGLQHTEKLPELYRSTDSKVIFGFCGGLSHKFNVNVIFIRIIFIFMYFILIWLYFFTFLLPAVSTKNKI